MNCRTTPSKLAGLSLLVLFTLTGAAAAEFGPAAGPESRPPAIVLDPGHGGDDAGLRPAALPPEKSLMLALAHTLQTVLQQRGLTSVDLTRNRDVTVALTDRQAFANRRGAGLYLSLHLAEPIVGEAPALRLFVNRFVRDDELAKLASGEVAANIHIFPADLAQNAALRRSQQLAKALAQSWQQAGAGEAEVLADAPLAGVMAVHGAAVLAEIPPRSGNSGPALSDPAYRQRVAAALADGIEAWLGRR